MIKIDKSLSYKKDELLYYFRNRGAELIEEVQRTYSITLSSRFSQFPKCQLRVILVLENIFVC